MQTKTKTEVYFHFIFRTHFLYNNIVFFSCEYFCVSLSFLHLPVLFLLLFLLTDSFIQFLQWVTVTITALYSDDLVWHILLFLAVKDLLRVRCVHASHGIRSSLFAKDHIRRSIKDPTLTNHHLPLPGPDLVIFISYSIKSLTTCICLWGAQNTKYWNIGVIVSSALCLWMIGGQFMHRDGVTRLPIHWSSYGNASFMWSFFS